jgi:hypothetical protein
MLTQRGLPPQPKEWSQKKDLTQTLKLIKNKRSFLDSGLHFRTSGSEVVSWGRHAKIVPNDD